MARPGQPSFLPKGAYRQRRVADAARMLPFAVAVLFLLPVLRGGEAPKATVAQPGAVGTVLSGGPAAVTRSAQPSGGTDVARFLFLSWAAAVGATFILSRRLARHDGGSAPDGGVKARSGDAIPPEPVAPDAQGAPSPAIAADAPGRG